MIALTGLRIREIEPADDPEALALEQRCPQGKAFRIRFERRSILGRTHGFARAKLLGAWSEGRLVAIGGGAIKDVCFDGQQERGLLLYDFRVEAPYRRAGVARALVDSLIEWARDHVAMGFAYAIGDNRAIQALAREWVGADAAPAFDLLAYPTHRGWNDGALHEVDPAHVRASYATARGDTRLACYAEHSRPTHQRVGSWKLEGDENAGCSVWTTRDVLEEVVLALPPAMRATGMVLGGPTARKLRLPHVPRVGERIRSWLVYDFHADGDAAAQRLARAVAGSARSAGIDYCHTALPPDSPLLPALRRDVGSLFAPVIPFTIMARTTDGRPLVLSAPIVDPQDI